MNGFIRFPLSLYTLSLSLSLAQSRVLAVIIRQTLGWHKQHDAISLNQFQHGVGQSPGTGMSRTHIIAAIRWLETAGIIRVVRQVSAAGIAQTSIYSLAEKYLDTTGPAVELAPADLRSLDRRPRSVVSSGHHGGSLETRPTKDHLLSKDTSSSPPPSKSVSIDDEFRAQHAEDGLESPASDVGSTPTLEATSTPSPACSTPEPPTLSADRGPALLSALNGTTANVPPPALLEGLLALGFSQRSAQQMLSTYGSERVHEVLGHLPFRNARNPAGYLVRELQAGDYTDPRLKPKPVRRLVACTPAETGFSVTSEETAAATALLQQTIAELDPDTRAACWEEARRQCARVGRKTIAEDSPLLLAQFEIMVQKRMEALMETRCCA